MKMLTQLITVLFCVRYSTCQTYVALMSKCGDKYSKSENAMGLIMSEQVEKIIKGFQNYRIIEFDVCDEEFRLRKVLVDLLLDPKWYDSSSNTNIKAVIAYMPEEMLKLTMAFLSTQTIVLPLTSSSLDIWFSDTYPNYVPFVDLENENVVVDILNSWEEVFHITVIEIEDKPTFITGEVVKFTKRNQKQVCIDYYHLHTQEFRTNGPALHKITNLIKDTSKVIFVLGKYTSNFMMNAQTKFNVKGKLWVLLGEQIEKEFWKKRMEDFMIPAHIAITNTVQSSYSDQDLRITFTNESICSAAFLKFQKSHKEQHDFISGKQLCHVNPDLDDLSYEDEAMLARFCHVHEIFVKRRLFDLLLMARTGASSLSTLNFLQFVDNKTISPKNFDEAKQTFSEFKELSKVTCPKCYNCKKECKETGICQIKTPFDESYGIGCTRCKPHMIFYGNYGHCKTCNGREIPNKNRTACYDPYIKENIYLVCYAVNAMGIVLCVFILIIYTKHRSTAVVRSSNYFLTVVQLSLVLMLFITMPPLMLAEMTPILCTLRPCIIGVLLTGSVSVVVCKAEKVLTIFHAKARLTKKDIFEIGVRQMFVLGILVTIDLIIIPATIKLPDTTSRIFYKSVNDEVYYYIMQCSSEKEFYLQIVYCITILMLGIIQGYRGRRLPTNYNEGNSIVVAAATTSVGLFFTIWFQHSGKYAYERKSTCWLCLSISLMFLITSLYAPKLYVILLEPEKNTKEHRINLMLLDNNKEVERGLFQKRKRSFSHQQLMEELANVKQRAEEMITKRRSSYDILQGKF